MNINVKSPLVIQKATFKKRKQNIKIPKAYINENISFTNLK